MAISVISSKNSNHFDGDTSAHGNSEYRDYPNYVRLVHFVVGDLDKSVGTELVVKRLLKQLTADGITGQYMNDVYGKDKQPPSGFHGKDWLSAYEKAKSLNGSNSQMPYVLLDGFTDQPINFSSYINWESGLMQRITESALKGIGNLAKEAGNNMAQKSGRGRWTGMLLSGGGNALVAAGNSNGQDPISSLYTTGATGWQTIKTPTGGNHMVITINLRKYDMYGDGAPLALANMLTIFCSPIKGYGELFADGMTKVGDMFKKAGNSASDRTGSFDDMGNGLDFPDMIWSKFMVGLVTNYKKVGAKNEKKRDHSPIERDDSKAELDQLQYEYENNIILYPMVITNFSYTPSENMILLSDGSVGPAYVEYQLSLSSLTVMSNIDIAELIMASSADIDDAKKKENDNRTSAGTNLNKNDEKNKEQAANQSKETTIPVPQNPNGTPGR